MIKDYNNISDNRHTGGGRGTMLRGLALAGLLFQAVALGQEWEYQESGTTINLNHVFFLDHEYGWVIGDSVLILHTSDGGAHWEIQDSPIDSVTFEKIQFVNEDVGYIVGTEGTILSTKDGGGTWMLNESGIRYPLMDLTFINQDTGWIASGDVFGNRTRGIILKTINGGGSWGIQFETNSPSYFTSLMFTAIEFSDSDTGWALAGSFVDNYDPTYVLHTTTGGATWDTAGVALTTAFDMDIFGNSIWVGGFATFGISSDGGESWIYNPWESHDIITNQDFRLLNEHAGWLLGAKHTGSVLLFTEDNWTTSTTLLSDQIPWLNAFATMGSNEIWAAGDSGIIMHTSNALGIDSWEGDRLPSEFELLQNHPNPFNSATVIRFTLPKDVHIQLSVFDILGREVAHLVDSHLYPGQHDVIWNGKTSNGAEAPSGVYIIRLQSTEMSLMRKMLVLR